MSPNKFYSTTAVAAEAGISRDTLLRWLKQKKVPEPSRNRNGWRIFTADELKAVVRFANKVTPSPRKVQVEMFAKRRSR